MPGELAAAALTGRMTASDPRSAVNLMLDATEGIKLRTAFKPQIPDLDEQRAVAQASFDILRVKKTRVPAAAPA
jgi:hypothetical protein